MAKIIGKGLAVLAGLAFFGSLVSLKGNEFDNFTTTEVTCTILECDTGVRCGFLWLWSCKYVYTKIGDGPPYLIIETCECI
jgi:hypothetical protein